jgi:hypothetical protein
VDYKEECDYKEEYDSHNETSIIEEEEGPVLVTLPDVNTKSQVSCMYVVIDIS